MCQKKQKVKTELVYKSYSVNYIPSDNASFKDFDWIIDPKMIDPIDLDRLFSEIYIPDKNKYYLSKGWHAVNVVGYWLMKSDIYNKLKVRRKELCQKKIK